MGNDRARAVWGVIKLKYTHDIVNFFNRPILLYIAIRLNHTVLSTRAHM